MFKSVLLSAAVLFLALSLIISCSDNPASQEDLNQNSEAEIMFIDEQVVLAQSSGISEFTIKNNYMVFDLSKDSLYQIGEADDIAICYCTPTSCDEFHRVYDFLSREWKYFATYYGQFCLLMGGSHYHALSSKIENPMDCINDSGLLRIKPTYLDIIDYVPSLYNYKVKSLKLNSGYKPIPLSKDSILHFFGLEYSAGNFWVARGGTLYQFSNDGTYLSELDIGIGSINGIHCVGDTIWISAGKAIYAVFSDGSSEMVFSKPEPIRGLTMAHGKLWFLYDPGDFVGIIGFDPGASLQFDSLVGGDTIGIQVEGLDLAWDGEAFLIAGEQLYRVGPEGNTINQYAWPARPGYIDYSDGIVYALCGGPPIGAPDYDGVIVPFRLR